MVVLTKEYILNKCKTDSLTKIKKLDIWSSELEEVSLIKEMPNIEICSLSLNKITTLIDFKTSNNLVELYLRKNKIADLNEILYL
jgi:Leucine-rich repeat (LRR) protein